MTTIAGTPGQEMSMNDYGQRARRFWQQEMPNDLAVLPDPATYFSTLGEQIAQQVETLTMQLAGPDRPTEGYLEKVGRLRAAQQQAEERVMHDLVYSLAAPSDQDQDQYQDDEDWDPTHPMAPIVQLIADQRAIRETAAQEANDEADRDWRERTGQPPQ